MKLPKKTHDDFEPPSTPMKRVLSDDFSRDLSEARKHKRPRPAPRLVVHRLGHVQPGSHLASLLPQDTSFVDAYLDRALSTALVAAGFDGAKTTALQSFRSQVEEYMWSFLSTVRESMGSARRTAPLPLDFIRALSHSSTAAPSSSLRPHLKPVIHTSISNPAVGSVPNTHQPTDFPETGDIDAFSNLLAPLGSAEQEEQKAKRVHIPSTLPPFPSTHTWKSSVVEIEREYDPLQIREQSTKVGLQAEQALRTLMLARQKGLGLVSSSATVEEPAAVSDEADKDADRDSDRPADQTRSRARIGGAIKDPVLVQWEESMKAMVQFDQDEQVLEAEQDRLMEQKMANPMAVLSSSSKVEASTVRPTANPTDGVNGTTVPVETAGDEAEAIDKTSLDGDVLMMDLGDLGAGSPDGGLDGLFVDFDMPDGDDLLGDDVLADDQVHSLAEVSKPDARLDKDSQVSTRPAVEKTLVRSPAQPVDLGMVVNFEQKYWRVGSSGIS